MVNNHIITFQSLLKELEKDIDRIDILMSQLSTFVSNISETWTAVSQNHQNMKREAEKI